MSRTGATGGDEELTELRQMVLDHPAHRRPDEHATAQFHLGVALIGRGRLPQAQRALAVSADLFQERDRPVEHAKATNMLGVALREQGELEDAADAFSAAAQVFSEHDQQLEHGAALHNLGLVRRATGGTDAARGCFERAHRLFLDGDAPRQAAAAARELAAGLLGDGCPADAAEHFENAIDLASKAGDRAGVGAAANGLGLAHLAAGDAGAAVDALRMAVASHPRRIRGPAYAMAQANLALALEQQGDLARARLAAYQAISMDGAAEAVVGQAGDVLERLGDEPGTILQILDDVPRDAWPEELRPEIERWVSLDDERRRGHVRAWVDGHVSREGPGADLAAAYLDVLLELPPDAMEALIEDTIAAADEREEHERDRLADDISRAMARFNVPQWMRLKDTFERIGEERGSDARWG